MLENPILGKKIFRAWHYKIQTNCFFFSQVTVKQSMFFSMNDNLNNAPRPNWEIQMDWENDV